MSDVVFGGGMGGARAAAARKGALLLEPTDSIGGRQWVAIPEAGGTASAVNRDAIAEFYGAAPYRPAPKPSDDVVFLDKQLVPLPLNPWSVRGLVPKGEYWRLLGGQMRARAEVLLRVLKGGGVEERTYRDWVLHRYGQETYAMVHEPYARKRFGDPGRLHVSAARVHHVSPKGEEVYLGSSPERGVEALRKHVGSVRFGLTVRRMCLDEGRVRRLETTDGTVEVTGGLYYSGHAGEIPGLLGEATPQELRSDCNRLVSRHRIQVSFEVTEAPDKGPKRIHWLSRNHPFFMLQDTGQTPNTEGRHWCGQISLGQNDEIWRAGQRYFEDIVGQAVGALGFPKVVPGSVQVERLANHDPGWVGVWHPVHARIRARLKGMGVQLVGRAGLHRFLDPGEELALVVGERLSGGGLDEDLLRVLGDPPVVLDDEKQRLDAFITR